MRASCRRWAAVVSARRRQTLAWSPTSAYADVGSGSKKYRVRDRPWKPDKAFLSRYEKLRQYVDVQAQIWGTEQLTDGDEDVAETTHETAARSKRTITATQGKKLRRGALGKEKALDASLTSPSSSSPSSRSAHPTSSALPQTSPSIADVILTQATANCSPRSSNIAQIILSRESHYPSAAASRSSQSPPKRQGVQIGGSDSSVTSDHYPTGITVRPKITITERFRRLLSQPLSESEEPHTPQARTTGYQQPNKRFSPEEDAARFKFRPLSLRAPPINHFTITTRADLLQRRIEAGAVAFTSTPLQQEALVGGEAAMPELDSLLTALVQGDYAEMNTRYETLCDEVVKRHAGDSSWAGGEIGKALSLGLLHTMKLCVNPSGQSLHEVVSREIDDHVADFRSGFALRAFDDLQRVFGLEPTHEHGVHALAALAQLRTYPPRDLIRQHYDFVKLIPGYSKQTAGWEVVLAKCRRPGYDDAWLRKLAWRLMLRVQEPISPTVLEMYLRGLPRDHTAATFRRALDLIKHSRSEVSLKPMAKHGPGVLAAYLRFLSDSETLSLQNVAEDVHKELLSALQTAAIADSAWPWTVLIEYVAKQEGLEVAYKMVAEFREAGHALPNSAVCSSLLAQHLDQQHALRRGLATEGKPERHLVNREEADFWIDWLERLTGAPCDDGIYSLVLAAMTGQTLAEPPLLTNSRRTRSGFHQIGKRVHGESTGEGVWERLGKAGKLRLYHTSDAMDFFLLHQDKSFSIESLHALLLAYAFTRYDSLDKMMLLHRRVCDALPRENTRRKYTGRRLLQMPPQLYEWLFQLTRREEDVKVAVELRTHLQATGSVLSPPARERLIVTLMSQCSTYDEAFEIYNKLRAEAPSKSQPFDVQGWMNIFNAFILFRNRKNGVPMPAAKMLDMLVDMRQWGCAQGPVYVILLSYLAQVSTYLRSSAIAEEYRGAVLEIHRMLLEEENDRVPQNMRTIIALMNAYNHLGMDDMAFDIWDRLKMSHLQARIGPAAMAVVFDTCGYSRKLSKAQDAFLWALADQERSDRLMNKNVWDAYVECQARCGAVEAAITTALVEMGPALKARRKRLDSKVAAAIIEHKRSDELQAAEEALQAAEKENPAMFAWQSDAKDTGTDPDSKTIGMLLMFAGNRVKNPDPNKYGETDLWWKLREHTKHHYPEMWDKVKHSGAFGKQRKK